MVQQICICLAVSAFPNFPTKSIYIHFVLKFIPNRLQIFQIVFRHFSNLFFR